MKYAAILLAVLALLFFTNPNPSVHRERVREDLYDRIATEADLSNVNPGQAKAYFDAAADSKVSSVNCYFFSLTRITYREINPPLERLVGIGLLGKVFLWSGM